MSELDHLASIPTDKFDTEAIARARRVGFPTLAPLLPNLLTWLQDMNWPVARPVVELLRLAGPELASPIKSVLHSRDVIWIGNVIIETSDSWHQSVWNAVECDLRRMRDNPTRPETVESIDQIAKLALLGRAR